MRLSNITSVTATYENTFTWLWRTRRWLCFRVRLTRARDGGEGGRVARNQNCRWERCGLLSHTTKTAITAVLLKTTQTRTINQSQTLTHLGHNQQHSFSGLHKPGRSTNYKHWLTWATTNNSPSQIYTNPDDQPTTNIDSPGSQPTTVHLRSTPTRTINQLQALTHLGHNQQQSISDLYQPGRSTNYKHWLTWVTTNNSPSQIYTNPDHQPTTSIDSPGSQPTTVHLRSTPTRTINQQQALTHLGHNQQQSISDLHQPGWSTNNEYWLTWVQPFRIIAQLLLRTFIVFFLFLLLPICLGFFVIVLSCVCERFIISSAVFMKSSDAETLKNERKIW